jgi:glucosamine-6-phosphate deaminase
MKVHVFDDKVTSGKRAAETGARILRATIDKKGEANIIVATGASQFEMLEALVRMPDIRWDRVTAFHLDEYVGIPITHPASFRAYLWERFQKQLPLPLRAFHYLDGERDAEKVCRDVGSLISALSIDLAFVGIGENGHLAFNDPPADFETDAPYLIVALDEACRRQQMGEGWFKTFADVPTHAISMSVRQIMKSDVIICTVPDQRKAVAVKNSLEGPVTNTVPASILTTHPACEIFMDKPAASLLKNAAGGR